MRRRLAGAFLLFFSALAFLSVVVVFVGFFVYLCNKSLYAGPTLILMLFFWLCWMVAGERKRII
jgi:hypothetical protein